MRLLPQNQARQIGNRLIKLAAMIHIIMRQIGYEQLAQVRGELFRRIDPV